MKNKEQNVLQTFFNNPKQWTFTELLNKTDISRPQLAQHLKQLQEKNIIIKHKEKGSMPYYTINNNEQTKQEKKLYAWQELNNAKLLSAIAKSNATTAILFGSMNRWDWYDTSDIDIFIYGEFNEPLETYEKKLNRRIQLHQAKNKQELQRMKHLLPSILQGQYIKGTLEDLGVKIDV